MPLIVHTAMMAETQLLAGLAAAAVHLPTEEMVLISMITLNNGEAREVAALTGKALERYEVAALAAAACTNPVPQVQAAAE